MAFKENSVTYLISVSLQGTAQGNSLLRRKHGLPDFFPKENNLATRQSRQDSFRLFFSSKNDRTYEASLRCPAGAQEASRFTPPLRSRDQSRRWQETWLAPHLAALTGRLPTLPYGRQDRPGRPDGWADTKDVADGDGVTVVRREPVRRAPHARGGSTRGGGRRRTTRRPPVHTPAWPRRSSRQ